MTKMFEQYRKLQDRLNQIRSLSPINEQEEDDILDWMDVAWDQMSEEERTLLDSEPART